MTCYNDSRPGVLGIWGQVKEWDGVRRPEFSTSYRQCLGGSLYETDMIPYLYILPQEILGIKQTWMGLCIHPCYVLVG
jgi:hypothetical protein